MKTVGQALVDEVHIPIPYGFVENACIKRDLDIESEFTGDVARSDAYKGTLADCLLSLIQAVSFSEADKSIGSLSEDQRKAILDNSIGEEEVSLTPKPTVYINC